MTTIADDGAEQNLLRGRPGRRYMICATAMVASALVIANVPGAATAPTRFGLFAQTELPLSSIVWTGRDWLYASETVGRFAVSDAQGHNDVEIAKISQGGEETRCDVAPGSDGFTAGDLYCHLPDNRVIHLERDGSFEVLATLPNGVPSDGAMAFDRGGLFRGGLVAATGGSRSNGGTVYVVHGDGSVRRIGGYPGPGGADNLIIAPARFGAVSRWILLAIDHNSADGRVVAVGPRGRVRVLTRRLPNGLAPIAAVSASRRSRAAGLPRAGLYIADESSRRVYVAPAAALRAQMGAVVVGSELTADFWAIKPYRGAYRALPLPTNLPRRRWNIEQSIYVR